MGKTDEVIKADNKASKRVARQIIDSLDARLGWRVAEFRKRKLVRVRPCGRGRRAIG